MDKTIIKYFFNQKNGSTVEEYEDAFSINEKALTFAISDGATEATFSKEWSSILVENFTSNPTDYVSVEWLQNSLKKFNDIISTKNLPWHAELKLSTQGAFATLATLQIDIKSNTFCLSAIGDSCVFWLDNEGVHLFPYRSVEEFQNRPYLLCSLQHNNAEGIVNQRQVIEKLSKGRTLFFMATDALACWFVSEYINKKEPWVELLTISNQDEFESFIKELRTKMLIKNDDVTLIIIGYDNNCEVGNNGLSINEPI